MNWAPVVVFDAPLQLSIPVRSEELFQVPEGVRWSHLQRIRQAIIQRWGVVMMGVCVQSLEGFSQMEFSSNRADVHPLVAGCEGDFWCLLERELSACPWLLLSRTQVALQFERYAGGTGFRWVNCKKNWNRSCAWVEASRLNPPWLLWKSSESVSQAGSVTMVRRLRRKARASGAAEVDRTRAR